MFKYLYSLVETNLDNGSIKALFAWIEWVTLTGVVLAVGLRINGFFVLLAALLGFLLYVTGLIGLTRVATKVLANMQPPKVMVWPIALGVAMVVVGAIFFVLVTGIFAVVVDHS